MNLFTKENKMISVIRSNYQLLPVLNRFGIKLGVKDYTIDEICTSNSINVQFFLAIINTYANEHYFPKGELVGFPSELLIDYLKKTHKYYAQYVIPSIEESIERLLSSTNQDDSSIPLIRTFFKKFKLEFLAHNQHEESTLFPYLMDLIQGKTQAKTKIQHNFEDDHLNHEDKLNDLKNVLLKYLEGNYNENLYNDVIFKLTQFEKDAKDHARIEDAILLPLTHQLEKAIK